MSIDTKYIRPILEKIFSQDDIDNTNYDGKYAMVHCPFHKDKQASAGINPDDGFFKCFACGCELQFDQFIAKYSTNNDTKQLEKICEAILSNDDTVTSLALKRGNLLLNRNKIEKLHALGINDKAIAEAGLIDDGSEYELTVPVAIDNVIYGYKYYTANPKPGQTKTYSTKGLINGLIIPFNTWRADGRATLICEGEKDMLVARSHGFNAITLTGGCQALPKGWEGYFVDRTIAICYDNDDAGKQGAIKLADYLFKAGCKDIRVVTNYYEVIKQAKEDVTDFFVKYGQTAEVLNNYIINTIPWTAEDSKKLRERDVPKISLDKYRSEKHLGKLRQSAIQVRAEFGGMQTIPKFLEIGFEGDDKLIKIDYEVKLEDAYGFFQDTGKIEKHKKNLANKAYLEHEVWKQTNKIKVKYINEKGGRVTVSSAIIAPYRGNDTTQETNSAFELEAYSFKEMRTNRIYNIVYHTINDEFDKSNEKVIIKELEDEASSIKNFVVDNEVKQKLDAFKATDIPTKINELYNMIKYNGLAYLNFDLWLANELTFHSCLWFKLNNRIMRGVIYTNVIGDTRVGKSEISNELTKLYGQGQFVNAKTTTATAIIGGYDDKTKYVKAGVLPRNHGGLVVLEEIHGLNEADYFQKITEVKSSARVRINRVSGELDLDCAVRLIEISNPKTPSNSVSKTVSEFPSGVEIIKSLIGKQEDIIRNDLYLIIPKTKATNPYGHDLQVPKLPDDYYQSKLKWVWSRKPDNIYFENEKYIWEETQKRLIDRFDCAKFSLLGVEAYQKVARMSVALASMLCSTTDYENILVKNEHVNYIISWIEQLYSNETMRIDKFAQEEKTYWECTAEDVAKLQTIYNDWANVIKLLEDNNEVNQATIVYTSGVEASKIGPLFRDLTEFKFIRIDVRGIITPTNKFRLAVKQIDKSGRPIITAAITNL